MSRKLTWVLSSAAAVAALSIVAPSYAADAKYIWTPPTNVTQALKIKMETKATEEILKKADEQCIDADCKKQVAECRAKLATCVIVPSKESVHESEVENN